MTATRIFTFSPGQTCPITGADLTDHYATITAPTTEQCWTAAFATFADTGPLETPEQDSAGEWLSRWTEHARITIGGTR